MAPSRESSPASVSGTASPAQLTPKSKVKALLAALDKDSDDESVCGSPRTRLITSIAKGAIVKHNEATDQGKDADTDASPSRKSDTDSEEEEDVVRPKGRMAARMQANATGSEGSRSSSEEEGPRERMRKMLKKKSKSLSPNRNTQDAEGSDVSDVPVISRKRKIRVPRRATPASSPEKAPASPGLFVSPRHARSATPAGEASDSYELPQAKDLASNARFLALIQQKREEREAKDAKAAKEKAERAADLRRQRAILEEDDNANDSDEEVERRLTQRTSTRKASKRALEEMHRETQRLSRNQQLAHNATTKKKFTRSDLFAKFNYISEKGQPSEAVHAPSSSPAMPHSDMETKETPPTSPVSHEDAVEKSAPVEDLIMHDGHEVQPTLDEASNRIPSSPPTRMDKGKGKAVEEPHSEVEAPKKPLFTQRPIRIRPPKPEDRQNSGIDDSDSDLEIVVAKTSTSKTKTDSIFDRIPIKQAKESQSIHALRMLAHIPSSGKQNVGRNVKPSITTTELQVTLQQRARQQAAREREERLEALRAKGVIIQTTEEREKELAEVEDLLARARREGEEIMKREKAAAKKMRRAAGEVNALGDSSDDEDWEENKTMADEEISGSGSEGDESGSENDASGESEDEEDEGDGVTEMDDEEAEEAVSNSMLEEEAAESEEGSSALPVDSEMVEVSDAEDDDVDDSMPALIHRRSRKSNVISDDEDSEEEVGSYKTPKVPQNLSPINNTKSPVAPNSVLRSATKTFIPGLPVTGAAGLGLTQIFAGTMDESQSQVFEASPTAPAPTYEQRGSENDPMAFLKRLPAPELPPFVATLEEDTQDSEIVPQSQFTQIPASQASVSMTQGININFNQSQFHGFDSLVEGTQMSPFLDATQDVGFQHMTPIKGRFVDGPPSTVGTVVLEPTALPETTEETPIVKKKGKLRRRAPIVNFSDDEDNESSRMPVDEDDLDITSNAFDVMRKRSQKKLVVDKFDKKKSEAKHMVQEQAEESEDEYAGLGGASDDESSGEEDAYIKEMIDDEAGKDANERELAAFFA
jgi:mediator of replication checkpoint protein 1